MTVAWKAQRERGNPRMIRLMGRIALTWGRRAARALLVPICLYYLSRSAGANRILRTFYVRALGRSPGWKDLFHHYYCFASTIVDRLYFLRGRFDRFDIRVSGADMLGRVLGKGRGCLLLGSHLGSFEILRVIGESRGHLAVNLVMHEGNARQVSRWLHALAPELAKRIIAPGQPETLLRVRECLERGELSQCLAIVSWGRNGP